MYKIIKRLFDVSVCDDDDDDDAQEMVSTLPKELSSRSLPPFQYQQQRPHEWNVHHQQQQQYTYKKKITRYGGSYMAGTLPTRLGSNIVISISFPRFFK